MIIRNLRAILVALLVPFFTEVVLRPLDAFHLGKKFVGKDRGGSDWEVKHGAGDHDWSVWLWKDSNC